MTMTLRPIGTVERDGDDTWIQIHDDYRPGLLEADRFGHVLVLWWASAHDTEGSRSLLQTELPYAPGVIAGVFACRAEYRPNPIAVSVCKLLGVEADAGVVRIGAIDAYDESPVLDIKPYIGVVDRVQDVRVPDWFEGWPEWMPDEGIGLYEDG